jgi:hypothetical protein
MILAALGLGYPLVVLGRGLPHFPSRADCVRPATGDGEIEAVLGRFDSEREAARVRDRAQHVGFAGAAVERDACGRVKVVVRGITTLAVGQSFADEAERVGFRVTLEQAG